MESWAPGSGAWWGSAAAVEQVPGRGRGVVARRHIRAGEPIVAERPLLHWCVRDRPATPAVPVALYPPRPRRLSCCSSCVSVRVGNSDELLDAQSRKHGTARCVWCLAGVARRRAVTPEVAACFFQEDQAVSAHHAFVRPCVVPAGTVVATATRPHATTVAAGFMTRETLIESVREHIFEDSCMPFWRMLVTRKSSSDDVNVISPALRAFTGCTERSRVRVRCRLLLA